MNMQQVRGNVRTRESRRKAKNRNKTPKFVSAHTMRFRTLYKFDPKAFGGLGGKVPAGESPPVRVKSLRSVGG